MKKIEKALLDIGQKTVDGIAGALEYTDSLLDAGRKKSTALKTKKAARAAKAAKKKSKSATASASKKLKKGAGAQTKSGRAKKAPARSRKK
ncbi:MAG: hypothetical protein LC659_10465 [Myxococcales bacterium]|nr:hypothetical protein [Myxococcales bacterium]